MMLQKRCCYIIGLNVVTTNSIKRRTRIITKMTISSHPTSWKLISQGAESKIFDATFIDRPCIVKERIKKTYRLEEIDRKLSHRRLVQEARCYVKARKAGILTPTVYLVDEERGRLYLEKIKGPTAKSYFHECYAKDQTYHQEALDVAYSIGKAISTIHDADVLHGDLTTSNFMMNEKKDVVIIDFGLGNSQPIPEDKAVDLYVMERAFISTHANSQILVDQVLRAYKAHSRLSDSTFQKLAQVRLRGRKRTMIG